jgi:Transposase DDE domain group 1
MIEGFRHSCFITNSPSVDIPGLELRHRGHARVEDRVRCWKDCGLSNLPFDSFPQNEAWVAVSLVAGALIAWAQMTCLDGDLAKAEPRTLRNRIFHVAALLVRRGGRLVLRLDRTWPWAADLEEAFRRLRTAFP